MRIKKIILLLFLIFFCGQNIHAKERLDRPGEVRDDDRGRDALWICQGSSKLFILEQTVEKNEPILKIAVLKNNNLTWKKLSGNARTAVAIEDDLYLAFDDGQMVRDGSVQTVLHNLPDNVTPYKFFADQKRQKLFLLASDVSKNNFWRLFQYVPGGDWKNLDLPKTLDKKSKPVLFADDGNMELFAIDKNSEISRWNYQKNIWGGGIPIQIDGNPNQCWPLSLDGSMVLVVSISGKNGDELFLYSPESKNIEKSIEKDITNSVIASAAKQSHSLLKKESKIASSRTPRNDIQQEIPERLQKATPLKINKDNLILKNNYAVSSQMDRIIVGFTGEDPNQIKLALWSIDGKFAGYLATVKEQVSADVQDHSLLIGLFIITMLVIMFIKRGIPSMSAAKLPTGVNFSPFWRRAVSFGVDFLIAYILLIMFLIIFSPDLLELWYQKAYEYNAFDGTRPDPVMFKIASITSIIYMVYCIMLEGVFGWTLGKLICRLQIRQAHNIAKKATWRQIVVRNAIKPFELYFFLLVFIILFTKGRRRIGDLLAGTVVLKQENGAEYNSA